MRSFRSSTPMHAAVIAALCCAGCTPEARNYIRFPDLTHPGPAAYQQAQAIQHDPYPLNDIGPEVVGGRPLAFQQSLTEPARARQVPQPVVAIQGAPPPGTTVMAPPVASSPFPVAPPQGGAPLTAAPVTAASPYAPPVAPITTTFPAGAAPPVASPPPTVTLPATPTYPPAVAPTYPLPATPTYPLTPAPAPGRAMPLQPRAPY